MLLIKYMITSSLTHTLTLSGPIFFYCGNEGPIESFYENTGFMFDIAPEFNAVVIFGGKVVWMMMMSDFDVTPSLTHSLTHAQSTATMASRSLLATSLSPPNISATS